MTTDEYFPLDWPTEDGRFKDERRPRPRAWLRPSTKEVPEAAGPRPSIAGIIRASRRPFPLDRTVVRHFKPPSETCSADPDKDTEDRHPPARTGNRRVGKPSTRRAKSIANPAPGPTPGRKSPPRAAFVGKLGPCANMPPSNRLPRRRALHRKNARAVIRQ